jgi:hypothetical protein
MKYYISNLGRGKILIFIMALFLSACGYQPSSHVIKNLFNDSVYVEVEVDRAEPENAPFVKDELRRMVYNRFKGHIVPKDQAESQIYVSYSGTYFRPLSYENGYVTRYRVYTRVKFKMLTKDGVISKDINTIYEADIQESALTSSAIRIEAIRKGLEKAMDEFMAYVSARSLQKQKETKKEKVQ